VNILKLVFLKRIRLGAQAIALFSAMAAGVVLSGCTTLPDDPEERAEIVALNDPLEPLNRAIFDFNRTFDTFLLRPVAEIYAAALPPVGQDMVKNFLDNLKAPVVLANDLMQGEPKRAGDTLGRFIANSTFGVVGLFDISGIEPHNEDFGQTLAIWGMNDGPFLMLPFAGPSSLRDSIGLVTDYYIDPFNHYSRNTGRVYLQWVRVSARAIDTRARTIVTLDEIERLAIDIYATYRSFYRQYRKKEILNGRPGPIVPMPQVSFDIEDDDYDDNLDQEQTLLLKTD
jgi:phospholipid-binding lipoprotein MlaA